MDKSKFPEIIYKYRNWDIDNHKRILTNNEIYFANPLTLNDPYDFRVTWDFSLLDSPQKIQNYFSSIVQDQWMKLVANGKEIPEVILAMKNKYLEGLDLQNCFDEIHQSTLPYYGVFSCSQIWNNILMWSHYANNHKGFVVGFYLQELFNCPTLNAMVGSVIYGKQFPKLEPLKINNIEYFIWNSYSKSIDWEYEHEFRFAKLFYPNLPNDNQRKFIFPDKVIAEVVIGSEADERQKNEIHSFCIEKKIPVYIIRKSKNFQLERSLWE